MNSWTEFNIHPWIVMGAKRKAAMKSLTVCNSAVMWKSAIGISKIYCEEYVAQYYTANSNFTTAYA